MKGTWFVRILTVVMTAALAAVSLVSASVLAVAASDAGSRIVQSATAVDAEPTPTPARSASPSGVPSPTPAPSLAPSGTPSLSPTPSPTPTALPSPRPSPTPTFRGIVRSGTHGRHEVALTFDDGFSTATIQRIGEILIREKVPATFFVIGRVAAHDADVIRPLAQAGFPFGSHTYDHGILTRSWLSIADIANDMIAGSRAIERVTGVPTVPFVRPPGGYYDDKVIQATRAAGFRALVKWTVDSGDALVSDPGVITWRAEGGWNGSIILMHMNRATSADVLPAIIASYRTRGYHFVTLGQMFGVPGPVPTFEPTHTASPHPGPRPTATPDASSMPSPTPTSTTTPTPSSGPTPTPTPTSTSTPRPSIPLTPGRGR